MNAQLINYQFILPPPSFEVLQPFIRSEPVSGAIADYNAGGLTQGLALLPLVVYKFLRIQGFLISDLEPRFPEGVAKLREWFSACKLTIAETVIEGFDLLPHAFIGLFESQNSGKMVVKVY